MKKATELILDEIADRVFAMEISLLWRSQELMPGAGERRSASRGSNGYEIVSRQPYEPGDDPRDIDRFATAQSGDGTMYTIQYQEPRDITIVSIVDVGSRMQFGTRRADKRRVSAEVLASILACTHKTQDRAKVFTTSEQAIEARIGPRGAKVVFPAAMEAILEPPVLLTPATTAQVAGEGGLWGAITSMVSLKSSTSLSAPSAAKRAAAIRPVSGKCEALSELPRTRSLVFVISDFIGLSKEEKQALTDAAAVHDVVCVVVQDKRERELPEGRGLFTLRDIVSGETKNIWLNDENRRLFKENAQKQLSELTAFLTAANCDWGVVSTEQSADEVIPEMMRLFGGHRR